MAPLKCWVTTLAAVCLGLAAGYESPSVEVDLSELRGRDLGEFDQLNAFFSGQTFGSNPGPCPVENSCNTARNQIADYLLTVPVRYYYEGWGWFDICKSDVTKTLGQWFQSGTLKLWNMVIKDLKVGSVAIQLLNGPPTSTTTSFPFRFVAQNMEYTATMTADMRGVNFNLDGVSCVDAVVGKGTTSAIARGRPTSLIFTLDVVYENGRRAGTDLPIEFRPRQQSRDCELIQYASDAIAYTGFPFDLRCGGSFATAVCNIIKDLFTGTIRNISYQIIKPLIGSLFCGLTTALIQNEVNTEYRKLYNELYGYVNQGVKSLGQIKILENDYRDAVPQEKVDLAMVFPTDPFYDFFKSGLNDYLGGMSETQGYTDKMRIVEFMDRLLENKIGELRVDDPTKPFKYSPTLPADAFVSTIPTGFAVVDMQLKSYVITGLNSFRDQFNFGNIVNTLDYTTRFQSSLANVKLSMDVLVTYKRGEWSKGATSRSQTMTLVFDMKELSFDAYPTILWHWGELNQTKLGYLLDYGVDREIDALNCFLKTAVYNFQVPSLRIRPGFTTFSLRVNDGGMQQFFGSMFDLFKGGLEGFAVTHMEKITENLIRPELNLQLEEYLNELGPCWNWVPKTNADYVDFEANKAVQLANDALNKFVGGNPIQQNSFDINSLLDFYLPKYETLPKEFGLNFTYQRVNRGEYQIIPTNPIRFESLDKKAFFYAEDFTIENLDSFTRLDFGARSTREQFALGKVGAGEYIADDGTPFPTESLKFSFVVGGKVCRFDNCLSEENAIVTPGDKVLATLEFDAEFFTRIFALMDNNKLMQLTLEQSQIPTCIFATLDEVDFKEFTLNTEMIRPTIAEAAGGNWGTFSVMGKALIQLEQELKQSAVYEITTNQVRYLMQRFADKFIAFLDASFKKNYGKITVDNCKDATFEFDTEEFKIIFELDLPDESILNEQPVIKYWPYANASSNELAYPAKLWENNILEKIAENGRRGFDVRENVLVGQLRDFFNSNGAADQLRVLANTTALQDYLTLNEDNTVDIQVNLAEFIPAIENNFFVEGFKVTLGTFTLKNVERAQFAAFKEYDPDAQFTTKHEIYFNETLNATLTLTIETDGPFVGDPVGTVAREEVLVEFIITDLTLDLITFLAIDLDLLEELRVDSVLIVDEDQVFRLRPDIQYCILKPVFEEGVGLPGFQISYDRIYKARVTPLNGDKEESKLFTDGAALVFGALIDGLSEVYKNEINNISQGYMRRILEDTLKKALVDTKAGDFCVDAPGLDWEGEQRFLDIKNSKQVLEFYDFAQEKLMSKDSAFNINTLVKVAMVNFFDDVSFRVKSLPLSYNQDEIGNIGVSVENVNVLGLDSVDQLMILDWRPVDGLYPGELENYTTRTWIGTGEGSNDIEVMMDVRIVVDDLFEDRPGMALTEDGRAVRVQNDLRMKFTFSYLEVRTDLVARLDIPNFMRIQLQSFLDIVQYPCFLEAFPENGLQVKDFLFSVGDVRAEVECIDVCNSPLIQYLEDGKPQESEALNKAITEGVNSTISLLNVYIKSEEFGEALKNEIDLSTYNCIKLASPNNPVEENKSDVAIYMLAAGLTGLFTSLVAMGFLVPVHLKRKDAVMKAALLQSASKGDTIAQKTEFVFHERKVSSAFRHPAVPALWRYLIPVWILVNIVFFFTANFFAVGATVELKVGLLGDTSKDLELMSFTLESSINDMWNAEVYFLSLAIAILSGFWPYIKLVLLLFCWFAPATVMSTGKREKFLEILDMLGKWSLIDVYVLVMLVVGFRFYVTSSYVAGFTNYFPADSLIVDVIVAPGWGIFGFCLGAIGSLFVNHVMIHLNRKIIAADQEMEDRLLGIYVPETPTSKVAVQKYKFAAADSVGKLYGFGPGTRLTIGALLVLSFVLILAGSVVDLITFEFLGATGIVLNLINPELASVTYSLANIATAIVDGSDPDAATRLGIFFLQTVYLMFALIVPLVLILVFGVLWFVPLRLQEQRKLLFISEILGAWEALIVFVASAIAAVFQISQLAQFIVKNATGGLCSQFEQFLRDRDVSESDSRCFDVQASLEPLSILLIVGTCLELLLAFLMYRLVRAVVDDRTLLNKKKDCINPKSKPERFDLDKTIVRVMTAPVARINLNRANQADVVPAMPAYSDAGDSKDDSKSKSSRSAFNPLFFGRSSTTPDIDV